MYVCVCVFAQLCLTLCDPMNSHLPGSSVHGMLQTRILERVAISYSRGSSRPRDWTCVPPTLAGPFFILGPPGKPNLVIKGLEWLVQTLHLDFLIVSQSIDQQDFFLNVYIYLCGPFFKVFIEFLTISFLFYVLVFWPQGMWDFSSPTRYWTCTPCIGSQSLKHWTTRKVPRVKIKLSLWLRGKEPATARKRHRGWETKGAHVSVSLSNPPACHPLSPCSQEKAKKTKYGYFCKLRCQVPRSWRLQDDLRRFKWQFSILVIFA